MTQETLTKLATYTIPSDANSYTFNNIPQGYTDLRLVCSVRLSGTDSFARNYVSLNFNSDFASNYPFIFTYGDSGSAYSYGTTGSSVSGAYLSSNSSTSNTFGVATFNILNYASNTYKPIESEAIAENNTGNPYFIGMASNLWKSNSPIISITITPQSGTNLVAGSNFTLYGIKNYAQTMGNSIKASGGDIITSDGTYVYHTFLSSGTFNTSAPLLADILVVAGGGGGGYDRAGGGGGGGVIWAPSTILYSNVKYSCAVGAGGATKTGYGSITNYGANSIFGSLLIANGGGGGADGAGGQGGPGGSGGGNGPNPNFSGSDLLGGYSNQSSGTGYTGYGNSGGNGSPNASYHLGGGGGGGAGASGGSATTTGGGNGGNGISGILLPVIDSIGFATNTGQLISGNYYYAGGGGGSADSTRGQSPTYGLGGYGGGGNAGQASAQVGSSGIANTGGGGGGGANNGPANGGAGGSGIIIIRYKA